MQLTTYITTYTYYIPNYAAVCRYVIMEVVM